MEYNYFNCPKCNKVTKQLRIPLMESIDSNMDKPKDPIEYFGYASLKLGDIIGFHNVLSEVTGIKAWKCCDCGLITERNGAGKIR